MRYNVNAEPQSGKLKLIDGTYVCSWPESLAIILCGNLLVRPRVDSGLRSQCDISSFVLENGIADGAVRFTDFHKALTYGRKT